MFTDNEWFDIRNDKIYDSGINGNRAIPVIEYPNNARRLSDIEMTIAITDAINVLTSDRINGVEQFVSAWVKFVNCEIDIDTFRKMRQEGALVVKSNNGSDNKADVDVMTSELNQTEGQVVFTDLFERFLSIQGLANRQGNTGGDTGSAVELRNGHYDAGLRTAINEPILKKSERMALRLILNRLRINKGFTLMPNRLVYYHGNMCIVAMRGRNPDNPSDRTVGNPTEQRLEVNMQGTSNCLTSVQKDNLVIESQVLTPKRTEYGKQIRKAYESGRIQESRHNMTELEPRKDDISNTLTTVQKDNLLLENNIQKVGQISSNGSQCGTVISDNGISANLVAGTHGYANSHIATQYRIRKLTPRECGRLMGVSDEDIDKMSAVNSNTQLYKQFGNSIVADVMCAMFKNLNIKQGDSNEALQTN